MSAAICISCRAARRGRIYAVGGADDGMSTMRELWRASAAPVKPQKGLLMAQLRSTGMATQCRLIEVKPT